MGRRIRLYNASGIYLISARTFDGARAFKPSRRVAAVVGGILARGCRMYGIGLRAFVLTGDGLRLLIRADGVVVSRFMQFVLGNISRKLRGMLGVRGPLWHRRFRCEPVLDPHAELEQLEEIIRLSLISLPGFTCLPWLFGRGQPTLAWYDWNRRWTTAGGRRLSRWSPALACPEELTLEPVTAWMTISPLQRQARARALTRSANSAEVAPPELWGRPSPCHATSALVRFQYLQLRRVLEKQFREASAQYLAGKLDAEFPRYAIRPCAPIPATVAGERSHTGWSDRRVESQPSKG